MAFEAAITLYFPAPNSFTGEDVLELQGHGGRQILNAVLQRCIQLGARLAKPGEFSERAFLNGKLDLTQAEAIADLIDASSTQAARAATRSLQGQFSKAVTAIADSIIALRREVEASIDFSDEEIEFQSREKTQSDIDHCQQALERLLASAKQGALLGSGIKVAIAGLPNAGKSSLLNALAGEERAIVTDIAGTTRDVLNEQLTIEGLPIHLVDTAGIRQSLDPIEQEGVRRAGAAINSSDHIVLVVDGKETGLDTLEEHVYSLLEQAGAEKESLEQLIQRCIVVINKIDLLDEHPTLSTVSIGNHQLPVIKLIAKTGQGVDLMRQQLLDCADFNSDVESTFSARQRHIDALIACAKSLNDAEERVSDYSHWELMAEDLRIAQQHLNRITGQFTNDDLLGEIFSSFCVGK
jgi:tRNA modification GTPase